MKLAVIFFIIATLLTSCAAPRPWTKQEKISAGYFCLAHFADYYTTTKMLKNPANWEINPAVDEEQPEIYFSLTAIGALVVGHFWPDARKPLFIGYGTLNAGLAAHNSTLH